ncbi:DNA-binding protein H-NS [Bradyrhizobium liaoningense]
MAGIVASFKALTLDEMIRAYPEITAALNAAKDQRRSQFEAEIRSLSFKPGEGKKAPTRAAKYVGPTGEVWTGAGAMASWLRKLKEGGEDVERYRASG